MAIITISKTVGTLAEEIAQAAATKLNYTLIDKQVAEALGTEGFNQHDQNAFYEKGLSFWEYFSEKKSRIKYSIKNIVLDFAQKGNVVLYGWGAQVLLKNIPGVLKVRVFAPQDIRLQNIMELQGCNRKTAEKHLTKRDYDSAGFIRSFYNYDWESNELYDLTLNTSTLTVDTGLELILKTLSAQEFISTGDMQREKLTTFILKNKIQAALAEISGAGTVNFSIDDGSITLTGLASSKAIKKECEEVVLTIIGDSTLTNSISLRETTGF